MRKMLRKNKWSLYVLAFGLLYVTVGILYSLRNPYNLFSMILIAWGLLMHIFPALCTLFDDE